jgi:hypothetical protein
MSAVPPNPSNITTQPPNPTGVTTRPHTAPTAQSPNDQIVIVSHSNLFYWWPVWAVGLVLFALTYFDGFRMAIVPVGTEAMTGVEINGKARDALVLPVAEKPRASLETPQLHATHHKGYAVLWATVLILVIIITNVPLRGMWSFVVIMLVIFLAIIFTAYELWDPIFRTLSLLDIRVNAGGYLFVSSLLLAVWLITFLLFDRQIYMVFTPGQLRVCTEIGGGEQVYDAVGMTLEKQRSDLFRHWILGLGSGDLVVKTSGAQAHHFDLPNVLFINSKVAKIQDMLKMKSVIETK